MDLGNTLKLDLLIEGLAVVEVKSVEMITSLYAARLLSYLRLSRKRLGLLINFNVPPLKQGTKRIINSEPIS
jgi:GxxExxY protein